MKDKLLTLLLVSFVATFIFWFGYKCREVHLRQIKIQNEADSLQKLKLNLEIKVLKQKLENKN